MERIPRVEAVIRNVSGEQMKFVDTIRMLVKFNGEQHRVAFHVGDGLGTLVILGTNALKLFGIELRGVNGHPFKKNPVAFGSKNVEQVPHGIRSTERKPAMIE